MTCECIDLQSPHVYCDRPVCLYEAVMAGTINDKGV